MPTNPYEPPTEEDEATHVNVPILKPVLLAALAGGLLFCGYAFYATLFILPPPPGKLMFPGPDGALFMGSVYFCFGFAVVGFVAAPIALVIRWIVHLSDLTRHSK